MINVVYFRLVVVTLGVLLIVLGGCGSTKPSRFYTLDSLKAQDTVQKAPSNDRGVSVAIGPIDIPDYLDRPQIVTRTSQNELNFAEFDRWAGSLQDDITRVLVENLSILLSPDRISVFSWKWATPIEYRVAVDIPRFEIMHNGNALLKAQWTIFGKDGKQVLLSRESSFSEQVNGQDYGTKVATMSRALANLSRDIADAIKFVSQGKR